MYEGKRGTSILRKMLSQQTASFLSTFFKTFESIRNDRHSLL